MNDPRTSPPTPNHAALRQQKGGCGGSFAKLVFFTCLLFLLLLPFTPFAGQIKRGIQDIIRTARDTPERVITKEIIKEVPKEIIKEVVKQVEVVKEVAVGAEPLPDKFIPRKEVDVAKLFNGITIKTDLITEEGGFASLERLDPEAYTAQFQLSIRVPRANQTLPELSRINPALPGMLPGLAQMLTTAKVSGFYHKLYANKTSRVKSDLTRLNKTLDRHNFYDCETILELTHPSTQRRALLIQSEMDVVADGSDGDRMPVLDEYIYLSDFYQPSTSYAWPKLTPTPNPLLAKWEERLTKAKADYAIKGLPAARNRELEALLADLPRQIADMRSRSFLIAEKDPFIVLSLLFRGHEGQHPYTPGLGDYAVVIHEGKLYPAICGDYGPSYKMGEASLLLAKTINPKSTPYIRGADDLKVSYLIFPGTAEKPNAPPNLAKWREKCLSLLGDIGGIGAGHELHTWQDPFAQPAAIPTSPLTPLTPAAPGTAPATTRP
ncbi:MAG: glycoside hydrolase family 75 protein [Verrucomicrobiaceae bacterium]|nr:glycoside hydrolase family 75 protein [Verrucomicrobiaceae bacterium]